MRVSRLSDLDRAAVRRAVAQGWLTLSRELGDAALALWQRQCLRAGWPFAAVRPDLRRATVWIALPSGREWSGVEWRMARDILMEATGVVLHSEGVRAFLAPGMEENVMPRLIALALAATPVEQANWQSAGAPLN
jgi:hypothetical protein